MLESVDLDLALSREEYSARREGWERELFDLTRRVKAGKVPVAIVFEGAQGAGMGRAIFDLTEKMDPRIYAVHPIAPPRGFERSRPWLWRFWMAVPAHGEIGIFDESWYLRVLGDRSNGDVPKKEWSAAYEEISSFERHLIDDGTVLIKLFFHIDEKTARRRYKRAVKAGAPHLKRRKRNLARFSRWLDAAEEMLARTSTEQAPWHVIPSKDERFARGRAFEIIIETLKAVLDERGVALPGPSAVAAPSAPPPPSASSAVATKDGAAARDGATAPAAAGRS